MNKSELCEKIKLLAGTKVENVTDDNESVSITFSNKANVIAGYWRIVGDKGRVSSFDHNQKYGLPEKINAIAEIEKAISGHQVKSAILEDDTGDIKFIIGSVKLEIFNFTGCEVWEINFPDGTGEYSNYV